MSTVWKNQKGFAIVDSVVILVVVTLLGFVGWQVWQRNNKTGDDQQLTAPTSKVENKQTAEPTAKAIDETADWLMFNAPNGRYSIRIPDGWKLVTLGDGSAPYALKTESISYQNGVRATVKASSDKEVIQAVFAMVSPTFTGEEQEPNGEKSKTYKTRSGLEVTQYQYYYAEEGIGVPKGSTEYDYRISDGAKTLQIAYMHEVNTQDQTSVIEKAIGTAVLH